MKNRSVFRNSNGFFIFNFTCILNLNALKISTLACHKTQSGWVDKKENI